MLMNNDEYFNVIANIKERIKSAQYKAVLGVNKEMVMLYWNIGIVILENAKWGSKFIENLARDIKLELPSATGYSVRNLKYMQKFAATFSEKEFVQQAVAQIPWGHITVILDKIKGIKEQKWYVLSCIENGWSRNVLTHQIELELYERQALADKVHNFDRLLAPPQSELAGQTMKDPYIFDFVAARENILEREIEEAMVRNVANMLLELGNGFAFLGNQYHITVSEQDFYIDLLFYHVKLRCYIAIDLKMGKFRPEYAGKMNFYLSVLDDTMKSETDNPSVGLILCKDENKIVAEYALKDMTKPIGVSEYKLTSYLPYELEKTLPSAEDIEKRIKLSSDTKDGDELE